MIELKLENLELLKLKDYGWDLPQEVIDEFELLPRETLKNDLVGIIKYYIDNKKLIEDEIDLEDFFLLHAVFLMAQFRIEEGLEVILELWSLDDDYLQIFFGDVINQEGWYVIFHLGQNQLDLLVKFILSDGPDTFYKIAVSAGMSNLAQEKPELKGEIAAHFETILLYFNSLSHETDIIDETLIAFILGHVVKAEMDHLDKYVKELYDKDFVDLHLYGSYNEMHADFQEYGPGDRGDSNRSAIEIYQDFNELFSREFPFDSDIDFSDLNFNDFSSKFNKPNPAAVSNKIIGRNDPCPCGSGKKYKKCCAD